MDVRDACTSRMHTMNARATRTERATSCSCRASDELLTLDERACTRDASRMTISSTVVISILAALSLVSAHASFAASQDAKPAAASTPPSSLVPTARTDEGSIARETELIRRARESAPVDVIFVGDSITQAWEGPGNDAWNKHIAPLNALNLGNSGDRTENVLYRLAQAPLTRLHAKHVVLLIGTNNLGHGTSNASETLAGITAVSQLLAAQCPGAMIHILEVFPRGPQMNPMRGELCQINQALRAFVRDARAGATIAKASPYAIHATGDAFLNADGSISPELMPDALHLTPKGYEMWAQAMSRVLAQ